MAEWGHTDPVVGIACDGIGHGTDNAAWGCELLHCRLDDFDRLGHLAYFPLVGGDAGAIETWRPAAALLRQACPRTWREHFADLPGEALRTFEQQIAAGVNAPPTSSLGRVFDAAAYLLGLCPRNRHEAEAAMAIEAIATDDPCGPFTYHVSANADVMSLEPAIAELAAEARRGGPVERLAGRFHETVARMLADAANIACRRTGLGTVALSGGCFANRRLLERLPALLEDRGRRVLYHRRVPSGDGGLALGQAVVAANRNAKQGQAKDV
jgi:hydrogenase maturation protein HypF